MVILSTIVTIVASSLAGGIGVLLTVLLIALLIIGFLNSKELPGANSGTRQKLLARSLNISVISLLIGFALIVGFKVAEILA